MFIQCICCLKFNSSRARPNKGEYSQYTQTGQSDIKDLYVNIPVDETVRITKKSYFLT